MGELREYQVPDQAFRQAAMQKIASEEGFRPSIYVDTTGNPTVGHGFRVSGGIASDLIPADVRRGKKLLDPKTSEDILYDVVPIAYTHARNTVGSAAFDALPTNAKLVLTDMAYQLGPEGLSGFKNMTAALQQGDLNRAAAEILDSKYAQKDAPNRARRNAQAMRTQARPTRANLMRQP